jgi:hypothetical protein
MRRSGGAPADPLRLPAFVVLAGAVLSGPVALLVVSQTAPQPPWQSSAVFVAHYNPVQSLPYVLGFLLLAGFVWFVAACHAASGPALRIRTSAAMVCTAVYATLVCTNYTLQMAFVPRIMSTNDALAGMLTMANPSSFSWFLEMFGYAAIGVATWLVSPLFAGSRRADAIRLLLIGNGVVSVIGAICTAVVERWVFSRLGMLAFAGWNILIVICFLLIATLPVGSAAVPDYPRSARARPAFAKALRV